MTKRYNTLIINLLLAVVVCLVVNFSYLLAIREQNSRDAEAPPRWLPEGEDAPHTGTLHIHADGYGYILCEGDAHVDSIYVASRLVRRLSLSEGNRLKVIARDPVNPAANQYMWRVLELDGEPVDYGARFDSPEGPAEMVTELAFYLVLAFVMLCLVTMGAARNTSLRFYFSRSAIAIGAMAAVVWLVIPGRVGPIDLMKCAFVLVFALLYGRTYQLIRKTEQLHTENLAARLNTLVGQINPHFLFNSLNSLSALVREGRSDDAVRYIDRLSDTFRYTIQSEPNATTTLAAELEFVEAYKYLLEVRYDGKFFVDIAVEPEKLDWQLPTFSIQPLMENAVKHNTISRSKPLRISIRTEGGWLVVSNPINPKLEPERGTGIGLENLAHRWQLLTGRKIEITSDGHVFEVRLPIG